MVRRIFSIFLRKGGRQMSGYYNSFTLIVVLFILLIIVGSAYVC
ncbi:YjcZ family sporulation protein [Alteribacillus sp. JSM 102045]